MIRFLAMYSGGLVSWASARRIVRRHGREGVALLFADTLMEDEDLYRFLDESAAALGVPLYRVCDGRDPWRVFEDEKFIGNSRIDPCSKILKRRLMDRWRDEHCDPAEATLAFGLDWSERGRIEDHVDRNGKTVKGHRTRTIEAGWTPSYPMDERPYLTRDDILADLAAEGIAAPRLYGLGFPHNNCGGFCCKMGHAQARHLLRTMPERYRWHEERERRAMEAIGPTARPFLRDRGGGETHGVTMAEYRRRREAFPLLDDDSEDGWGCGGGCAID